MKKKINIRDFNIDISSIPEEILNFPLSERRKNSLNREYGSASDFILLLYYLRFTNKLEGNDIAKRLNMKRQATARIALYNFGWHHSTDYQENIIISNKQLVETKNALTEAKEKSFLLNANEDAKLQESLNKKINKNSYLALGFKTKEEYIRTFYYLFRIKGFPPRDFLQVLDLTHGTIQSHLRKLGINLSRKEGMRGKADRGSQDYGKTRRHAKRTRSKSIENSNNQDFVREQLANIIDDYFDNELYEVVVGMSNTEILGGKEIDIPIIVINFKSNQFSRFAIEYNAKYFHTEERDLEKEKIATAKGWRYIALIEENKYSDNRELLEKRVHELCREIKSLVKTDK